MPSIPSYPIPDCHRGFIGNRSQYVLTSSTPCVTTGLRTNIPLLKGTFADAAFFVLRSGPVGWWL